MQRPLLKQTKALRQVSDRPSRNVSARAATLERQRRAPAERQPREENVTGTFYVDHTCIDCDTCRWMDAGTYSRVNSQTAVHRQPETPEERQGALQALLACPTFSIHCDDKQSGELRAAAGSFPKPVPGSSHAYHCGFHSESSFGATSYLLVREAGNVLVDSPRFDSKLLKNIQVLGGAKYMFLTHRDDVADHSRWASALGCQRIIHAEEANDQQQTTQCEIQLEGEGPWRLPDGGDDVDLIFTPGHTEAHVVMHHHPDKILFSGDHLMFRAPGNLSIAPWVNWYSKPKQMDSARKVSDLDIDILLPGQGRRGYFADKADRAAKFAAITPNERRL